MGVCIVWTDWGTVAAGRGKAVHNAEYSTASPPQPRFYPQRIHNRPTGYEQVFHASIHTMHRPYYCY